MAAAQRLWDCLGTQHPEEIRGVLSCQVFRGRRSQAFSPNASSRLPPPQCTPWQYKCDRTDELTFMLKDHFYRAVSTHNSCHRLSAGSDSTGS